MQQYVLTNDSLFLKNTLLFYIHNTRQKMKETDGCCHIFLVRKSQDSGRM